MTDKPRPPRTPPEHGRLQELKPRYQDHLPPKSFTADAEAVPAGGAVAPPVNIVPSPHSLRGAAATDLQHAGRRRRRSGQQSGLKNA
ncbi:hypothetical protein NDU88_007087 [Pleurodeles waltl]|uniref:Uncharacterized protein n=1 Tax=Pleurodeles waltl TaxID=8319 RepID=A0AAV7TZF7_PLEWA|nr:hypothetical protein NDU88_007087 [Pleurodeles waltl]